MVLKLDDLHAKVLDPLHHLRKHHTLRLKCRIPLGAGEFKALYDWLPWKLM